METYGVPDFALTRSFHVKAGYTAEARVRDYDAPGCLRRTATHRPALGDHNGAKGRQSETRPARRASCSAVGSEA